MLQHYCITFCGKVESMMKILHIKAFRDVEDQTSQYMIELNDGYRIYAGFWRKHNYEDIVSVSTQVGCRTQCMLFCNVKKYLRDITKEELLFQIESIIKKEKLEKSNVKVSMVKEGEPFDNRNIIELIRSIDILGIPYLKISTSLPVECEDTIKRVFDMAQELNLEIQLQISLSSTDDNCRNKYVARRLLSLEQISFLGKEIYEKVIKKNRKYNYITLSFTIYEESRLDIDLKIFFVSGYEMPLVVKKEVKIIQE